MVHRNQDVDQVVRNVQQNNFWGHNNITNMVKPILARSGLNVGMHKPNFVSVLSDYVFQIESPSGWKIPKFTKFAWDINEFTVKHVAMYQLKVEDISNNENLKMKLFLNSLTKDAFT